MVISIQKACELYGYSDSTIHALYHYDRRDGVKSHWLVMDGDRKLIDTVEFERQGRIVDSCKYLNTIYLYWLMMEIFGTETKIALYMCEHSKTYNSKSSWIEWLSKNMWGNNTNMTVRLKLTQHAEFLRLSTRAIYKEIKAGRKLGRDWEDDELSA